MNRTKAIEIYLSKQSHAKEQIRRIMKWNNRLSIRQNSISLKIDINKAATFIKKYRLSFNRIGSGNNYGKVKTH